MKKLLFLSIIILIFTGCSDKNANGELDAKIDSDALKADSANNTFFPVTSFLKGQLILLDSIQVTLLQVNSKGGKSDSLWLPREKIRPLLQPFIADVIDNEKLAPFFKESKFNDQSTAAITFTYDPRTAIPDSIAIRHWDVYVNPETGTVKRVYILKTVTVNNQVYTQQLTWQTDKWAKLVNILNKPGGQSEIESEMRLIWDLSGNH